MPENKRSQRDDARRAAARRHDRRRAATQMRRRNASAAEESAAEPAPTRRRLVVLTAIAAALAALIVGVVIVHRNDGRAAESRELNASLVAATSAPLGISAAPPTYTVTYRLESAGNDPTLAAPTGSARPSNDITTSTEQFRVVRPFRASVVSTAGAPPGGAQQWSIVSAFGLSQSSQATSKAPKVDTIQPGAGIGDFRLDAVLTDLVADGTFVLGARRTLLGRECQVYRTGSPLEDYSTSRPTADAYADVCIDGAGLVLEQVAVDQGKLIEHLTAVAVDAAATIDEATFTINGTSPSLDSGGLALTPRDPSATDDPSYWRLAAVPSGYSLQGRYSLTQNAVSPTDVSSTGDTTGIAPSTIVMSSVDVYTSGPNVIVVEQGPTSVEPSSNKDAAKATSSAVGSVALDSKLTGSTLLAHPTATPGWFVDVSATMPRAQLLSLADGLQHTGP